MTDKRETDSPETDTEMRRTARIGAMDMEGAWMEMIDFARSLERRLIAAEAERNLAIAHDTQPYPTAWAYEQVCAVLAKTEAELAASRADASDAERYRAWRRFCVDNQNAREGEGSDTYEGHDRMVDNVLNAQKTKDAAIAAMQSDKP